MLSGLCEHSTFSSLLDAPSSKGKSDRGTKIDGNVGVAIEGVVRPEVCKPDLPCLPEMEPVEAQAGQYLLVTKGKKTVFLVGPLLNAPEAQSELSGCSIASRNAAVPKALPIGPKLHQPFLPLLASKKPLKA